MNEIRVVVTESHRDTSAGRSDTDAVDATLAAAGDAHAFERLYRAHVARVHSLARRMLGSDAADEVTQDAFVRAWQKLHTFRGDASFGTWLHRLAINVILGRRQQLGTARNRFSVDDAPLERTPSRSGQSDFHLDFEVAITRLPPRAREVFVLHDVEGFKHQEIADLLGVTAGTSKAQLHRARQTLRKYLDR